MEFAEAMETVARWFELVGVGILVAGGIWAGVFAILDAIAKRPVYDKIRQRFGRALLLGLEVLVAADIIKTVTVSTDVEAVTALGILVIVRILLGFAINVEINHVVPWKRPERDEEEQESETRDGTSPSQA